MRRMIEQKENSEYGGVQKLFKSSDYNADFTRTECLIHATFILKA